MLKATQLSHNQLWPPRAADSQPIVLFYHPPRAAPTLGPQPPPLIQPPLSSPNIHIINWPAPARQVYESTGASSCSAAVCWNVPALWQVNISASELVCGRWLGSIFDSKRTLHKCTELIDGGSRSGTWGSVRWLMLGALQPEVKSGFLTTICVPSLPLTASVFPFVDSEATGLTSPV